PAQPIALRFTLTNSAGKTIATVSSQSAAGGIATGELAVIEPWANGEYELRVAAQQPDVEVRPHARKLQIVRDVYYDVQVARDRYKAGEKVQVGVQSRMLSQLHENSSKSQNIGPMNAFLQIDGKSI